jgi:hypothetical protein
MHAVFGDFTTADATAGAGRIPMLISWAKSAPEISGFRQRGWVGFVRRHG